MQQAMYHIMTRDQRKISILTYCKEHNQSYNVIYKLIKEANQTTISEEDLDFLIMQSLYHKNVHDYNIRLQNDALIGISIYTNGNKNTSYRRLYRHMSDHGLNIIDIEEAEAIINTESKKYTNLGLWIITKEGQRTPLSSYFHTTSGINYISLRDYMRLREISHINELFVISEGKTLAVFKLGLNLAELTSICDYMLKYETTIIDYNFLRMDLSRQTKVKRVLIPNK